MDKKLKPFIIIDKIWKIFSDYKVDEEMIENILESIYITNLHVKILKNKNKEKKFNGKI